MCRMDTVIRPTGIELSFERLAIRPKPQAKDLAEAMGISPSRLSRIENDPRPVTESMARRYRAALGTFRTSGTEAA